jgi:hypothetical protein
MSLLWFKCKRTLRRRILRAFAYSMERLRKVGSELVFRCTKQHSEPTSDKCGDKRGTKADELHLTPLELIDSIAALVPPPRTHRNRYFGVLVPNSPLRAEVTAMACSSMPRATAQTQSSAQPATTGESADETMGPEPVPPKRAAHYMWAVLIARIYEVFPLLCPLCGGYPSIRKKGFTNVPASNG